MLHRVTCAFAGLRMSNEISSGNPVENMSSSIRRNPTCEIPRGEGGYMGDAPPSQIIDRLIRATSPNLTSCPPASTPTSTTAVLVMLAAALE